MKFIFILMCLVPNLIQAQIIQINLTINGLTCSQCTYGVEQSIKRLSFITSVKMDLNTHQATVYTDGSEEVSIEKVAQQVVKAGFSLGQLKFIVPSIYIDSVLSNQLNIAHNHYCIINTKEFKNIQRENYVFEWISKEYLPKFAYKKWKSELENSCPDKALNSIKPFYVLICESL